MTSEDVQSLNNAETNIKAHLTEALWIWDAIVKFYVIEDPGLAFDLRGDPPAWVTEVTKILQKDK